MKLSKTSRLLIAIGIFVILLGGLGMAYGQQNVEKRQLERELSFAQLLLTRQSTRLSSDTLSSQQRELEGRLVETESQIGAAIANLRQSIESIEVTDTLFETAQTCDVEITEINSPGVTSDRLGGLICSVISLELDVRGDVSNLINFVFELSKEFPTGVVEWVEIDIPVVTEVEGEAAEGEEEEVREPSANLQLRIHTYEGD